MSTSSPTDGPSPLLCLTHVDFSPRDVIATGAAALLSFAAALDGDLGSAFALQQLRRPNHFELVVAYVDEEAHAEARERPEFAELRREIAPLLGSPFEERRHAIRSGATRPLEDSAQIVILDVELPRGATAAGRAALDELTEQFRSAGAHSHALLERLDVPGRFELVSGWRSPAEFDQARGGAAVEVLLHGLDLLAVAPVDERRHEVLRAESAAESS